MVLYTTVMSIECVRSLLFSCLGNFLAKSYFSHQSIFIIILTTSYNTSHIFPNVLIFKLYYLMNKNGINGNFISYK